MGINKIVIFLSGGLVLLVGLVYYFYDKNTLDYERQVSSSIKIEKTWELPEELEEVSGIAFLDPQRIVGIQDEDGTVYIYNLNTSEIEKRVQFGESGDYEGIATNGKTIFVLNSSGKIYVIDGISEEVEVKEFSTRFTSRNDMESLFLDSENNRLLMAVKEKDPDSKSYKGIYAFNLDTMSLEDSPVYKLSFEDKIFDQIRRSNPQKTFFPSEIALDRQNNLYVLEGKSPRLLVLDPSGKVKALHVLDKEDFPQPEGLAFDEEGKLYISNEGKPATVHQVLIK